MSYYVGTDIGGTFTDLVMLSDAGEVTIVKAPTTPDDRTRGVLDAFDLAARELGIERHELVVRPGLFRARHDRRDQRLHRAQGRQDRAADHRGFADVLAIQRCMASWAGMLDHEIAHYSARIIPEPIIARDLIEEIDERVDYKGASSCRSTRRARARACAGWSAQASRRSRSCCCGRSAIPRMSSARDSSSAKRRRTCSSPSARRSFRSSVNTSASRRRRSTAISARSSIATSTGWSNRFAASAIDGPVSIMESGGGVLPASEAAFQAANLLTSGPAGGVLASQKLGEQLGYQEHHHRRHGRHELRCRPDRRWRAAACRRCARSDASTSRCRRSR